MSVRLCPDKHLLTPFVPEVSGWCCQECGEDLAISQDALQCDHCGGLSWCFSCANEPDESMAHEFVSQATVEASSLQLEQQEADTLIRDAVEALELDLGKLTPSPSPLVELHVCSLTGHNCVVEVDHNFAVFELKQLIETRIGLQSDAQILLCGGIVLQDEDRLESMRLGNTAQLTLLCRSETHTDWARRFRDFDAKLPALDARRELTPERAINKTWVRRGRPSLLRGASADVCTDEWIVLEAVSRNGCDLQHASNDLKRNPEIVVAAAKQCPEALKYAAAELTADPRFAASLIAQCGGMYLQYLSDTLKADPDLVILAVTDNGAAIQFAPEELQLRPDILTIAYQNGAFIYNRLPGVNPRK